jgi:Protein of unknown function (DUF3800)
MAKRRIRLYIDESGDHTFRPTSAGDSHRRYLCLLGCAFETVHYKAEFSPVFEALKSTHFECDTDEKIIFHREDIVARRHPFSCLTDKEKCAAFDADLLSVVAGADFRAFAVLIDKATIATKKFGPLPSHPYHTGLLAMMERYCGWLAFTGSEGDVMAESRGGREDLALKAAYKTVYNAGTRYHNKEFFQSVLTSNELKLKKKEHNICGLQLSDILAYPARRDMLCNIKRGAELTGMTRTFAEVLMKKYNRQVYQGRISGYGKIFLT